MGPGYRRVIDVGSGILEIMPRDLVCRPLSEVLVQVDLSPSQRLYLDDARTREHWDSIRSTYCTGGGEQRAVVVVRVAKVHSDCCAILAHGWSPLSGLLAQ